MKVKNSPLIAFAVALAFAACNRNILYSHYHAIDSDGWERPDTLFFFPAPPPHAGMYDEELWLRTDGSFPFTSITVIVDQQAHPSGIKRTDTVCVDITDRDGNIQGKGIDLYQYKTPLPRMKLLKGDTLKVSIRHNMLRQRLKGITDVGFTLSKP